MTESEVLDTRVGDEHVTPEQIMDVNIGTYGPGDYMLPTGKKCEAQLLSNNTVRIFDGAMVYCGVRDVIAVNNYHDVTIENGQQGMNRNDIIVRHFEKEESTQYGKGKFQAVKGTPTSGTATDPDIAVTDLRAGALTHDMKLYRARLEGLNVVAIEPLFETLPSIPELNGKMFMCELTEFDTTTGSGTVWRATEAGVTRSLTQPITDFKMIGFMVINGSVSDNITHRQVQWYPAAWLKQIIDEDNASRRRIMFNYTRSETGRRVWVILNSGSYTNITFAKADAGSDTYDLIVWGLK